MLTIWKYDVPVVERFVLSLPTDARILSLQVQDGMPRAWVLLDKAAPRVQRCFRYFGTGARIPATPAQLHHVGTIQLHGGPLVFHLFEVLG